VRILRGIGTLALVAACLAPHLGSAQQAQAPSSLLGTGYVFPSAANARGKFGVSFRTRITLLNPGNDPITIKASLMTPDGSVAPRNIELAQASFRTFDNFLQETFGFTGGAGILLVEATGSHPFLAVGEVYSEGTASRNTTPLRAVFKNDAVVPFGGGAVSIVAGLRADSANRANFGCANSSTTTTIVHANFWGYTNGDRSTGSLSFELGPGGWRQDAVPVTGDTIFGFVNLAAGETTPGVYCYGVNVNNASGDGAMIPAVAFTP
jgi:hypothetical protein